MNKYIYEYENWTNFTWDSDRIYPLLNRVSYIRGKLFGKITSLGFSLKEETLLRTLTIDVVKSSEIEGENLNYEQVRSSIARKLGIEFAGMIPSDRNVEGVVEMMLDATQNFIEALTEERLFAWHYSLFPFGRSGMYKIDTGIYRREDMQIVSGAMGKEKIHYKAPSPDKVYYEMNKFIEWFNEADGNDYVIKAAIAHFWFIIIHPFDDGNGRIARALSDLLLSRADGTYLRFYSLSSQILIERKEYYQVLQEVQCSDGDITDWLLWFLECLYRALVKSEDSINLIYKKVEFWDKHKNLLINSRQRLMINKLLDGFEGKLKTSKWAKITNCSTDTALRDIKSLIEKGILKEDELSGRSTNYIMIDNLD